MSISFAAVKKLTVDDLYFLFRRYFYIFIAIVNPYTIPNEENAVRSCLMPNHIWRSSTTVKQ